MSSYHYPKSVSFKCARCATCCGDTKTHVRRILLLRNEAKHISTVSGRAIEEFAIQIVEYGPYAYEMKKTLKEKKCVFLDGVSCRIYTARPIVCRFYPFELSRGKRNQYSFSVTTDCPGIGNGETLKRGFFENLFQQACRDLG